jgi:IS30 family transposase
MHMFGLSSAEIARRIGRHRGSVGREIKRNTHPSTGVYFYDDAQRIAQERCSNASRRYKLDQGPLGDVVRSGLQKHWSPEQIVGRIAEDHPHDQSMRISIEAIYKWVYRNATEGWHCFLRSRRPRRRRQIPNRGFRGQIPGRVGIEHRPAVVDDRKRFGDWEADTMQGAKGTGGLATHVERRSRFTLARRIANQRASTFTRATLRLYRAIPSYLCRTMTCDNGKEFSEFKTFEKQLEMQVYFARPYAAWERGTNENTNGLLREFFPKGTDFTKVTDRQVAKAVKMLNNRPRKCLNYRTPHEVLSVFPGVALRN